MAIVAIPQIPFGEGAFVVRLNIAVRPHAPAGIALVDAVVEVIARQGGTAQPKVIAGGAIAAGVHAVGGIAARQPFAERYADVERYDMVTNTAAIAVTVVAVLVEGVIQPVTDGLPAVVVAEADRLRTAVIVPVVFVKQAERQRSPAPTGFGSSSARRDSSCDRYR